MARIRTIKPSFFRHEDLQDLEKANLGKFPMLVFAGIWGHCDKMGRFEWRPRQLKLDILPFLEFDMAETMGILERAGFLRRYSADGKQYGVIDTFEEHQRISGKESQEGGKCPEPPGKQRGSNGEAPGKDCEADGNAGREGKGREEEGSNCIVPGDAEDLLGLIPDALPDPMPCPAEKLVDAYHRLMPDNPRCKVLNVARRGAIKARWTEAAKLRCAPFGYSTVADGVAAWERFFSVCASSEFLTGKTTPKAGAPPFVADIDFLFAPSSFAKCLENKYHRNPP